ncbi:branched-chain amino acid transport system ATP-binding protein [Kitasatospora sp. MAA4]|uniref:ABC transporter ATP-binding protein n=1 Tax=Kitasatospora sp. MAA4 TaxID=3035093 RepID=UPI002475B886|nr:ATP-binding cassette domain-containing protein [Kitasatospora sp. MAA4]MDH6132025.1 branched-chain amino acid transport system ATP-binding protein [Kitasatospora sp. MAA4]
MLEIQGLGAGYGGGTVLHGIDLTLPEGSMHAVLGHNGAGKTTLLHTVAGLVRPSRGSVTLAGRRLDGQPPHRIAQAGVGLVPQGRRVFARLTVAEHLALAHRRPRGQAAPWTPQAVLRLLPRLDERRSQLGGRLSGGEQQMLALARALLGQPRLLLLDEPTEGLAPAVADEVLALTRRLADDGLTVLLAAPQLRTAAAVAERLTVLTAGRTTATQDGAAARTDPSPLLAALSFTPDLEATP